jgi:hypothetical protein
MIDRVVLNICRIFLQVLRNLPIAANIIHQQDILKKVQNMVCYDQSNLADYIFVSSRKHKYLKMALTNYKKLLGQSPESQSVIALQNSKEDLRNAFHDLESFLDNEFTKHSIYHFELLVEIFKGKSITSKPPRVCIKGYQKDQDTIITLVREESHNYLNNEYTLDANSAFENIVYPQYCDQSQDQGIKRNCYFCSNIPLEVKKGHYKNARINSNEVVNHYSTNWAGNLRFWLSKSGDRSWQRCWKKIPTPQGEYPPPISSCYKSTLVIPLSLPANKGWLSQDFKEQFKIEQAQNHCFFGFLCLDHQNIGYFKDEDIDISYIFADILSLFLIQKLTCSAYSEVWKESSEILEEL